MFLCPHDPYLFLVSHICLPPYPTFNINIFFKTGSCHLRYFSFVSLFRKTPRRPSEVGRIEAVPCSSDSSSLAAITFDTDGVPNLFRRVHNSFNHKNYNFLACDWFKKVLFSTNSLAKLLSDSLLLDSLLLDSLLSDS